MASPLFSQAVLKGAQKCGVTLAQASQRTSCTTAYLQQVLQAKASLKDAHIRALEAASGSGAGQLTIESSGETDPEFAAIMKGLDSIASPRRGKFLSKTGR